MDFTDVQFVPNTSVENLGANGAGITTLMNIAYGSLTRLDTTNSPRNEPDFATPYLYNYINKQAKSVQQSRGLGYK